MRNGVFEISKVIPNELPSTLNYAMVLEILKLENIDIKSIIVKHFEKQGIGNLNCIENTDNYVVGDISIFSTTVRDFVLNAVKNKTFTGKLSKGIENYISYRDEVTVYQLLFGLKRKPWASGYGVKAHFQLIEIFYNSGIKNIFDLPFGERPTHSGFKEDTVWNPFVEKLLGS